MKSKTINLSDLYKHNRLDAVFYLKDKPKLERFFQEHTINTFSGNIKKFKKPLSKPTNITEKLTAVEIKIILALIDKYEKYESINSIMRGVDEL